MEFIIFISCVAFALCIILNFKGFTASSMVSIKKSRFYKYSTKAKQEQKHLEYTDAYNDDEL